MSHQDEIEAAKKALAGIRAYSTHDPHEPDVVVAAAVVDAVRETMEPLGYAVFLADSWDDAFIAGFGEVRSTLTAARELAEHYRKAYPKVVVVALVPKEEP